MNSLRIGAAVFISTVAFAACGDDTSNILDVRHVADSGHHNQYDAGFEDTEVNDAGETDAGVFDGALPDVGETEAGTPDTGAADAGETDVGQPDASTDAGIDVGVADAGQDAGADAGAPDTGHPQGDGGRDAGTPDTGIADAGPDAGGVPTITTVSPDFGTVEGGIEVTLTGSGFTGATQVTIGGVTASATVLGDTGLTFSAPAHPAGLVPITITNGAARTGAKADAFTYVLRRPAAHPVNVDGSDADWNDNYLAGTEATVSDWASSNLKGLYLAYDDAAFYVAVRGVVESGATNNAMVVYIDRDFGASTGVANMTTLTDTTGALDNACSGIVNASGVAGFGAEYCLGTFAMSSVTTDDVYPTTDLAGMRDIVTNPADLQWVVDGGGKSLVAVSANATLLFVEMRVPWTVMGFSDVPTVGTKLALFVRIADAQGTAMANQSLPSDNDADPVTVSQVATVEVR